MNSPVILWPHLYPILPPKVRETESVVESERPYCVVDVTPIGEDAGPVGGTEISFFPTRTNGSPDETTCRTLNFGGGVVGTVRSLTVYSDGLAASWQTAGILEVCPGASRMPHAHIRRVPDRIESTIEASPEPGASGSGAGGSDCRVERGAITSPLIVGKTDALKSFPLIRGQ